MLYPNTLKRGSQKSREVSISFAQKDEFKDKTEEGRGELVYNFIHDRGVIKAGMGFEKFAAPQDAVNIDNEVVLPIRGTQVKALDQLCWHDETGGKTSYYIFYYNNEGYICNAPVYEEFFFTDIIQNDFTQIPTTVPYKDNNIEFLIFSGKGTTLLIGNGGYHELENVPSFLSCINHYGMFFGITLSTTPPKLVYTTQSNIETWDNTLVENLDFTDERGDLTKLISFNDYVYIFRNYGITQLSKYSPDEEFSISHMYRACSYINPRTICAFKDNVYFVEDNRLKAFNGNTVKDVEVKAFKYMRGVTNTNLCGTCFQGKYFLACKCNFGDGESIGCESYTGGYVNNALISYDLTTGEEEILRGVDINQIMNFVTPFKSKLLACFKNQHIDKIGQLTFDGKLFGQTLQSRYETTFADFGEKSAYKTLTKITYKSSEDFVCTVIYDGKEKSFTLKGEGIMKSKQISLTGKEFKFVLKSISSPVDIDDFVVTAKVRSEN